VIGTDAFSVTENSDGTTTVSGLYVSDSNATAPNDTFTIGAAASSASGQREPRRRARARSRSSTQRCITALFTIPATIHRKPTW
jgi:hypothetical protein